MKHELLKVCVTGAGGTIGSAVVERLLGMPDVEELRLLSLTELSMHNLLCKVRELGPWGARIVPIIGSVTNSRMCRHATKGVDTVIHCAAHKHVSLCEANPMEAIVNNVGGTLEIARAADIAHAHLVHLSTDKAVEPTSVMGKTKRVAERYLRGFRKEATICRLVNVWGSSGSVIQLWEQQAAAGKPLRLTDPECERFFMSRDAAAAFLLVAAEHRLAGTYLWPAKPQRMGTIAAEIAAANRVPIDIVGLQQGERLEEPLYHPKGCVAPLQIAGVEILKVWEPPRALNASDIGTCIAFAKAGHKAPALQVLDFLC